jgi:hypothetical protein
MMAFNMPNRNTLPFTIIGFSLFVLCLSACSQNVINAPLSASENSAAASAPVHTPEPMTTSNAGSVSPEDVVYSFLTAYENNPDEMNLYLGAPLNENLPAGGIQEVLDLTGTMNGFIITSGAGASDTLLATVEAHLQMDQNEIVRIFTLLQDGKTWLIIKVEAGK